MRKLASLAASAALLLSVVSPAFAYGWGWMGSSDVAAVTNRASASANTGDNVQGNGAVLSWSCLGGNVGVSGNNEMSTGNASAYAGGLVVGNTHKGCSVCGMSRGGHRDYAGVTNSANASANTGVNGQGNGAELSWSHAGNVSVSGSNTMNTGNARSESHAWTVVNSHWSY